MNLQGTIKQISPVKTYGNNGFRKRELVIVTDEQYPQTILVEFIQDKTQILDHYAQGQEVRIGINLRGREWVSPQGETKYFNTIQGWKIESLDGRQGSAVNSYQEQQKPSYESQPYEGPGDQNNLDEEDQDDLPF